MPHLIIEYRLDGNQPGYAFVPPTDGFDERLLRAVWRGAMPRGQGWGSDIYLGARSLKCFPVDRRIIAVSEVTGTDQADEQGRRGIRRAVITLIPVWKYGDFLRARLAAIAVSEREAARHKLTLSRWVSLIEKALPRFSSKPSQIVLAHPYQGPEQWQMVEALVLTLAISWKLRALYLGARLESLTTLALTHRDESRLVALPLDRARALPDAPLIDLS